MCRYMQPSIHTHAHLMDMYAPRYTCTGTYLHMCHHMYTDTHRHREKARPKAMFGRFLIPNLRLC